MTTSVSGTTRFVGRHRELASVKTLLEPARPVTLTGPGGVGKSRLAARVLEQHHDEAWLIDLGDVTAPHLVALEVSHRLGLRAGPGTGRDGGLVPFLTGRPALLVLDNVDRVLDATRLVVQDLVVACPALSVVVTSRETLGLEGEQVVRLAPLSVPAPDEVLTPSSAGRAEAVRLFVDRAVLVDPAFRLTEDNVASVAALCRALDGLPLALEIAAARSRELSPEAMLERLRDRYRLLDSRLRDVPERLSSLDASVTWSHDLCSPAEQALWARLSVFPGGFGLPAAESVCAGDGLEAAAIPALLESLVAKSIVSVDREVDPPHHRMLDSIREYGAAQLAEHDDPQRWRDRHGRWYADLATLFAQDWAGPGQAWWLARMRLNHANLVAVLDSEHPDRLRLVTDAEMYWVVTGSLAAARRWFDSVLRSGSAGEHDDPVLVFRARCVASYFASLLLDPDTAQREVDDLSGHAEDGELRAWLAHPDGVARLFRGDLEGGIAVVRPALADAQESGQRTLELNLHVLLAMLHVYAGDTVGAEGVLAAALSRSTEIGDAHARSFVLWISGRLARDAGDLDGAAALELDALALKWPLRDVLGMGLVLEALATIALARGDLALQGRLLGAAARLWRRVATTPVTAAYTQAQRELEERLLRGDVDPAFARAYDESVRTDVDVTIADLLERRPVGATAPAPVLSPREREVAALVGEGLTNQQIATRLFISVRTVHGHMENILRKLGFGSRAQVAAWIARQD